MLAGGRGRVIWTRTPGRTPVDRVSLEMPGLASGEVLRDALHPRRALGLIAIIDLLRRVTREIAHEPPPVRATLLFDDPNLRWRSYGYIDFRHLLQHAEEHSYHAAMAMIPLDASRPHASAVSLFRRHPERLSLVVHGNNHERLELMQPNDIDAALELGAQALRRVARFEATCGVRVGPVMVPPHGMCSRTMAGALAALPFDALCAAHAFPWTEHVPAHELLAGWTPASFAEGCAVILRVPFGSSATEIALRAYIDQPIVLYGHHEDVAGGLDVLAEAASRVNRLGNVQWTSLEEIACGNAGVLRDRNDVSLQAYSHRVRIPEGAESLTLSAPVGDHAVDGWSFAGEREIHPFGRQVDVPEGAPAASAARAARARSCRGVAAAAASLAPAAPDRDRIARPAPRGSALATRARASRPSPDAPTLSASRAAMYRCHATTPRGNPTPTVRLRSFRAQRAFPDAALLWSATRSPGRKGIRRSDRSSLRT